MRENVDIRELGASEVVLSLISQLKGARSKKKRELCQAFLKRYPEMIILQNLGRLILQRVNNSGEVESFLEEVQEMITASKDLISQKSPKNFPKNATVITLSKSSTVLAVLEQASHRIDEMIVLESRPALEGRIMSKSIAEMGINVKIIADAAANLFMGDVDLAVIGADAILPQGHVVNKIGSFPLALLCQRAKKPFFVISSLLKTDIYHIGVDLEERTPEELWEGNPKGVSPINLYFEQVPRSLLTGIWCEKGIIPPKEIEKKASEYMHGILHG